MQWEKRELLNAPVINVEGRAQITIPRDVQVVGRIGLPHRFAQVPGNLGVLERDVRIGNVPRRSNDKDLPDTNQDHEDQTSGEQEDEECLAYASILPQAN
jgi:hypothetical protein